MGTWTVSDSQIVIKFNDATRASATIRLKKKDPFLGTITFQDGETWTCELRRAMVIAYWQHQVGSSPSVKLRFWSNGYVDYANGLAFWRKSGTKLTLQWPNGDIDSCSFSSSGRFYTGRNKRGERVHGVRSDQ